MNDGHEPSPTGADLPFPLVRRGKVREVYDVGGGRLLLVASDRISAFDVVLPDPIPGKGEVLTLLTAWWLARVADLSAHHLIAADADEISGEVPELGPHRQRWARRALLCVRTRPFPVEWVVRGYLAGSAWREYRESGTLVGEPLPAGLRESEQLPEPLFSPATKAQTGHDENIPFDRVVEMVGEATALELRARSLALYRRGSVIARDAGILVADTKFEFGRSEDGRLLLIDEVLTPDSSRFWPADSYGVGRGQPSLDKQPVRDWLEDLCARGEWDKRAPGPTLPEDVIEATSRRYRDVFRRLTGVLPEAFPTAPTAARRGRS